MKKFAIIVAAGNGKRMGGSTPKQFLLLKEKPVLYYSLKAFLESYEDIRIILVLPAEHSDIGKEVIDAYFDYKRIDVTSGGETRFDSVKNGLQFVPEDSIVFVHDAARCLLTPDLIRRCYEHTLQLGSAVPVIRPKDSMRLLNEEQNDNEVLDRNKVVLVQTPQTFYSKILKAAYEIGYKERFTDEATVVETLGMKISLIEGEETNIKITTPVDLLFAQTLIDSKIDDAASYAALL